MKLKNVIQTKLAKTHDQDKEGVHHQAGEQLDDRQHLQHRIYGTGGRSNAE